MQFNARTLREAGLTQADVANLFGWFKLTDKLKNDATATITTNGDQTFGWANFDSADIPWTVTFSRAGTDIATHKLTGTRSADAASITDGDATGDVTTLSVTGNGTMHAVATITHTDSGAVVQVAFQIKNSSYRVKLLDEIVNNSQVLQTDDALNGWSLEANTAYAIQMYFRVSSSATADLTIKWAFSEATQRCDAIYSRAATTSGSATDFAAMDLGVDISCSSGAEDVVHVIGSVMTHATNPGTLDFQWAQRNATNLDTTIFRGAWMTVTKLQ